MTVRDLIAIGACVLVAGGLGLGFSEIGSPALNRMRAQDARLQQAIHDIAAATTARAPDTIARTRPVYPVSVEDDLRTSIAFENRSASTYALCATFATAGDEFARYGMDSAAWQHPAGRYCYRFHWKREPSDTYEPVPLIR